MDTMTTPTTAPETNIAEEPKPTFPDEMTFTITLARWDVYNFTSESLLATLQHWKTYLDDDAALWRANSPWRRTAIIRALEMLYAIPREKRTEAFDEVISAWREKEGQELVWVDRVIRHSGREISPNLSWLPIRDHAEYVVWVLKELEDKAEFPDSDDE